VLPTVLVAAALVAANEPGLPELSRIPGPYCLIPCTVTRPGETACVQLYVSNNRGTSWVLDAELAPDKGAFTFCAKQPGEYWFAARVKKRDGTFEPADVSTLVPELRVLMATGTEPRVARWGEPPSQLRTATAREIETQLSRLETDLLRFEVALIRKEMDRLMGEKEPNSNAEERIAQLWARLQQTRERLKTADAAAPGELTLPPLPPANASQPAVTPTGPLRVLPPIPSIAPVAPPPHAPVRRW
jgi:hypothetical protein